MIKKVLAIELLVFAVVLCCMCNLERGREQSHEAIITVIEQNLVPSIIIEGEDTEIYDIVSRMAHHNVPGLSMTFFDEGEIKWTRTYGVIQNGSTQKVDDQTLFQAASISKPVAAAIALRLQEKGLLDLDAPVNQYLQIWRVPENRFTQDIPVTTRHLVTHTGGMTVHGFRGYAADEDVPTVVQILVGVDPANSNPIVADTVPGSIWRYSGGGYTVYQLAIEEITKKSFEEVAEEEVLSQLAMSRSIYRQPLPESWHSNAAVGHRGNGNEVNGGWHTYPEKAAAGLWTTPSDLARFAIAVQKAFTGVENQWITTSTAQAMLTKHLGDWGLGFALNGETDSLRFGHGGSNEGFRCQLVAFADMGQGMALMTNGDNGSALINEILRAVSREYGWNIYKPTIKKVIAMSVAEKNKFSGTFVLPGSDRFTIDIALKNDNLEVAQRWNDESYTILPEGPSLFFDRNDGASFDFALNSDGQAIAVTVNGEFELIKN